MYVLGASWRPRGTAIFFGICAAAFLPMYFGAIYIPNMSRAGAFASFITGTFVSLFWIVFIHDKESKPLLICKALFGTDSLAAGTSWTLVDPLVIALPASIIATVIFGSLGRRLPEEHVRKCFKNIG